MQPGERIENSKIETAGFRNLDTAEIAELNRTLNKYATRYSEICTHFERLKVSAKAVHEREHSELYEVHARVYDKGKQHTSSATNRNMFAAVEQALRKIESSIKK